MEASRLLKADTVVGWEFDAEGNITSTVVVDSTMVLPDNVITDDIPDGIKYARIDVKTKSWVADIKKYQDEKAAELDAKCKEAILGRFKATLTDGVEYEFSYDTEAQSNFSGMAVLFFTGKVSEWTWTAYEQGVRKRITINLNDFNILTNAILQHKDGYTVHYNELLTQIYGTDDHTVVEAIQW